MSEHPKANALAENVYIRLIARLSMLVAGPLIALALTWIWDISKAQDQQSIFQATQSLQMELLTDRVVKLEDAGKDDAQVLQRLATVEALMRNLADQSASTRASIDNLTTQLIKERRSDAGEFPSLK